MMRNILKIVIFSGVAAFAPAAFGTSLTAGGTGIGTNTETFLNFGGITGLTLTVKCGTGTTVGGSSCTVVSDGLAGNLAGIGVSSTGNTAVDIQSGEFLQFTFSSSVTLTSLGIVNLDDSGTNQSGGKITNGGVAGTSIFGGTNGAFWTSTGWTAGTTANGGAYGTHAQTTNNVGTIFDVFNAGSSSGNVFDIGSITVTAAAVPEPATLGLVGLSLLGIAGLSRRKRTS